MAKILGIGIATLDIINTVDHYPLEDEELRAVSQQRRRGGNVSNTLAVLSQYSHTCFWAGVLCKESDAEIILQDFQQHNIDYQHCKVLDEGKVPTSYITINQRNGSRTIVHYRNLPEYNFADFKKIPLTEFDWIHLEARVAAENVKMILRIKQNHPEITVSIEIEKVRAGIEQLLRVADIYYYSKHFANALGFDNAKNFLSSRAAIQPDKVLLCAWGEQGAYCLVPNQPLIHQPAFSIQQPIETLGAGDTFNAGIIQARLNKNSWAEALKQACRLAAKKCNQQGFEDLV